MSNLAVALKMDCGCQQKACASVESARRIFGNASVVILNPVDSTGPTINMRGHSADTRTTNQALCGRWIGTR